MTLIITNAAVEYEFVADRLPSLAAVIGSLDQLAKPAVELRGIKPTRISNRARQMEDLPADKMRAAELPTLSVAI